MASTDQTLETASEISDRHLPDQDIESTDSDLGLVVLDSSYVTMPGL
jgi:hypothetical protein